MWKAENFLYSRGLLRAIARDHIKLYDEGLIYPPDNLILDPLSVVEYKVDFDMALAAIGRGKWCGDITRYPLWELRHFGRLQRLVIADIRHTDDWDLGELGFYKVHLLPVSRLRGYAYWLMKMFLNEGK